MVLANIVLEYLGVNVDEMLSMLDIDNDKHHVDAANEGDMISC
jgi:hypothetical protein